MCQGCPERHVQTKSFPLNPVSFRTAVVWLVRRGFAARPELRSPLPLAAMQRAREEEGGWGMEVPLERDSAARAGARGDLTDHPCERSSELVRSSRVPGLSRKTRSDTVLPFEPRVFPDSPDLAGRAAGA